MKSKKRVFIALLLTFCFMSIEAVGCGEDKPAPRETPNRLASISVTAPTKTAYCVGEALDLTGLAVDAEYDDGSTNTVATSSVVVTGYDKDKLGLQYVLVSYTEEGYTVTEYFAVTVKERLSVKNGSMEITNEECVSRCADSLAVVGDGFAAGTLSVDVKAVAGGDNGIIFGASAATDKYWESGASYYFFFISRDGSAFLGKVHCGVWSTLSVKSLGALNYGEYHELKCERYTADGGEYDVIRCYVDGVLQVTVRDFEPLTGMGYGYRAGSVGVRYKTARVSAETGDREQPLVGVRIRNGDYEKDGDGYRSTSGNAILNLADKAMAYGTFTATVTKNGAADDGIIFGLSENGLNAYWESGVSYYFFFISNRGTGYLGKVNNGTWTWLGESATVAGYNEKGTYMLRVTRAAGSIKCYVDGVLCVDYRDLSPLTGVGVGLRAGASGVKYDGISVENSGEFEFKTPDNFTVVSGEFKQTEQLITSVKSKSLMVYDAPMTDGTVSVKMTAGGDTNNGIVFRLKSNKESYYDRERGVSYYFFHISSTHTARLLRIENETATTCEEVSLVALYSAGAEYTLKAIVDGGRIMCYINDAMYVDYTDDAPLDGNLVGLRASASGVAFRQFETGADKAPLQADVVLFGHSHAQLWENVATDLASLGSVANLGVGGTSTIHWVDRVKHIVSYDPKYVVMWLGSNDIAANVPMDTIVERARNILAAIRAALPDAKIVLFTEFYQPGGGRDSEAYRASVRDMNARYTATFGGDYIICDLFDVAMTNGVFDASKFRDVYHLKKEWYAPVKERLLAALAQR